MQEAPNGNIQKRTEPLTFETERTLIRPTILEDASFLLDLMNSPKWHEFIGDRHVHSIAEAKKYIKERMLPQLQRLGYSNYTVIRKSDRVKIGTCGLYDRDQLEGVDIGFAFLPAFEKQGYAYESTFRLLQAAFDDFGLNEVFAITIDRNADSKKLLKKLGLIYKKTFHMSNDPEELLLYQISKTQTPFIDEV